MTSYVAIQLMEITNAKDLWEVTQDFFGVQSRAENTYPNFPDYKEM